MRLHARWKVCLLSLLFTYLFFFEYLPPFRWVTVPYDLPGFHYPLADYAFQALSRGRFPQWDPSIYCGLPFAGNVQAALFYPGTWLLLLGNVGHAYLSFLSLEEFAFLHIWLAFLLCYIWLRCRLEMFPSLCGAGVFAYGGYAMLQLQHLGMTIAYAWLPLGMAGVDDAAEGRWRSLWKTVIASAMAFLGGYPPTWIVLCVCLMAYATFRRGGWKVGAYALGALAFSLGVAAIQILPALEPNALKTPEIRYGPGIRDPMFYISYFVPNFYDFGLRVDAMTNFGREYLYIGVAGLIGLAFLTRGRPNRDGVSAMPPAGVLVVSIILMSNLFNIVSLILGPSLLASQVVRDWCFLAGVAAAAAVLAAIGLDRYLREPAAASVPRWATAGLMVASSAWILRLIVIWKYDNFVSGWAGVVNVGISVAVFCLGLLMMRRLQGRQAKAMMTILLALGAVDLKVYGTSKRFNATKRPPAWTGATFPELNRDVYRQLRRDPGYRIAIDSSGPSPLVVRHFAMRTPQGFDPFFTTQYKTFIERAAKFRSNWEFDLDPANEPALRDLGVKYFITSPDSPLAKTLESNPGFRVLEHGNEYYRVFHWTSAAPSYGWDGVAGTVQATNWQPEWREFAVSGPGGRFYLSEQWTSGWSGAVDGIPARIARWKGAFQVIDVAPGDHRVSFRYHANGLVMGAVVSTLSLTLLAAVVLIDRRGKQI